MRELVQYLNSLHRFNGSNINTTAEVNLSNEYAERIKEPEEHLVGLIIEKLRDNGKVLLTGFAGDGKTTLASLVAKQLVGATVDFSKDPVIRFEAESKQYVIIKDLSEIPEKEAEDLLFTEITSKNSALLIVSNTGTIRTKLLNLYESNPMVKEQFVSESDLESRILGGIECAYNEFQGCIDFGLSIIHTFNLVKRDNLKTAKNVLIKILSMEEWDNASEHEKKSTVHFNVRMMRANNFLAVERMFTLYRRVYEYGARLTMRNLLEHFAYTITGNRNSLDIDDDRYFFTDNFFGAFDSFAMQLDGVAAVRKVAFGQNIASSWKRRIWSGHDSETCIIDLPEDIKRIKRCGPLFDKFCYLNSYFKAMDRISILRIVYFLNNAGEKNESFDRYVSSFLNSPAIGIFLELQDRGGKASKRTINKIDAVVKNVLRDYCAGMKVLPDSSIARDRIFITMARKSKLINQSTQIVLNSFMWHPAYVRIGSETDSRGIHQFSINILKKEKRNQPGLVLDLPLLDYFFKISSGLQLDGVDSAFQKRLDNIKLCLLENADSSSGLDDSICLIYKDINNRTNELIYTFEDDVILCGD